MIKLPNYVERERTQSTRFIFSPKRNGVQLDVDAEWSSVLCPSPHDRIELGTCDRRPGALLVFVDPQSQGHHKWRDPGNRGALRIRYSYKGSFDWCRNLLREDFEFVPRKIEPLMNFPGIRGFTIDWPGWVEVIASNLFSDASEGLLRAQVESMRFLPEIFPPAFIDGKRLVF